MPRLIICDASPLILLAKINQLDLIHKVLDGEILVLQCIVDEVCSDSAGEVESIRLNRFLETVKIVDFVDSDYPSKSLSTNDRSVLNWSIQNRPEWLVADERLLRRIAREENLKVIGTLGILVAAHQKGLLAKEETKQAVDELVSVHKLRISVTLYQKVIQVLDTGQENLGTGK
jgi:predicted nucleic acid-binding protein